MLWLNTSGRAANSSCERRVVALGIADERLDHGAGDARRGWRATHAATWAQAAVGEVVAGHHREHRVLAGACARPPRRPGAARRHRARAACCVSTRQNPQARVQRSPSTMNVAVPSAQHSLRFGQPASSHTVTRPRSRTVFFIASTSVPELHLRPQPLGLAGRRWPQTPARPTPGRPRSRREPAPVGAHATARPGPRRARTAPGRSGACFQATSWRSMRAVAPDARRRGGRRCRPTCCSVDRRRPPRRAR